MIGSRTKVAPVRTCVSERQDQSCPEPVTCFLLFLSHTAGSRDAAVSPWFILILNAVLQLLFPRVNRYSQEPMSTFKSELLLLPEPIVIPKCPTVISNTFVRESGIKLKFTGFSTLLHVSRAVRRHLVGVLDRTGATLHESNNPR
jgi:hypothetical protein